MLKFVENQPFTMTASVSGASPTGAVRFETEDATILCAGLSNVPLSSGTASCTTNALTVSGLGTVQIYTLTANYAGDGNNATSGSSSIVVTALDAGDVLFRSAFEMELPSCPIE
jgi:hypothetical protein